MPSPLLLSAILSLTMLLSEEINDMPFLVLKFAIFSITMFLTLVEDSRIPFSPLKLAMLFLIVLLFEEVRKIPLSLF